MYTRFVEVTDGLAYGKFLVCRFDIHDLQTNTAMPEAAPGTRLLTYSGRRRFNDHSTLVVDLQRGTAAAWPLNGPVAMADDYLHAHLKGLEKLVCPLYLTFVRWLYDQGHWGMGAGSVGDIPRYIDLREQLHTS